MGLTILVHLKVPNHALNHQPQANHQQPFSRRNPPQASHQQLWLQESGAVLVEARGREVLWWPSSSSPGFAFEGFHTLGMICKPPGLALSHLVVLRESWETSPVTLKRASTPQYIKKQTLFLSSEEWTLPRSTSKTFWRAQRPWWGQDHGSSSSLSKAWTLIHPCAKSSQLLTIHF